MAVSPDFRDYVLDLLEPLGRVRARAMFGGAGLYLDDTFFAILANDVLYLKVDERNRGEFEAAGAAPFKPFADKPHTMSYYEAPADVMEESDELCAWARRAWEAARRAGAKGRSERKRTP
ncbi:MAG: TfoX/Sxy family protein [Rhodospirillales bacterium]|nr:TfoX/Sxy family protein [Pseudomonadota bacterium]